jgi:hypothetical protein
VTDDVAQAIAPLLRVLAAVAGVVLATLSGTACGQDEPMETDAAPSEATGGSSSRSDDRANHGQCLVRLHGKGGGGAETVAEDDGMVISPGGNRAAWSGRQWLYFPADEYAAARQIVADSVEGCEQIILNGFSNGAAFAAALYCRGESFDGRLVGVVLDDPVPDHGVDGCAPDPDVELTLYWTGALEATAQPGWSCSDGDWTCAGGETIGIEAYADALGTEILESPFDEHQWYVDAPETTAWPA